MSPSTTRRRRRSYSARIASTSASAVAQRDEGGVLRRRRGRHDPVLVDLDDPLEDAGRRADVADAPAGHRVGLAEAAHQHRPLAHPGQRAHRPVAVVAVREPVVDLVGVDEQVVADGDRGELVLDLGRQDGAGRVAGEAEEEAPSSAA